MDGIFSSLFSKSVEDFLKLIGFGSLIVLFLRPKYESWYFRRKYFNQLNRIKKELAKIPYAFYVDSNYFYVIKDKINNGVELSPLDEKILSKEVIKRLDLLKIPLSRASDYLNEVSFFRVVTIFKTLEKLESEIVKYLKPKDVRQSQHILMQLKLAKEAFEESNLARGDISNYLECIRRFNFNLDQASNEARYSMHLFNLSRWDIAESPINGNPYPIFENNKDLVELSKTVK